jgi:hypothetical protein
MHSEIIWLFKELKRIKTQFYDSHSFPITLSEVKKFCKGIIKRRYAIAMMGALFDLTYSETPIGDVIREIDRVAISHTATHPELKMYDRMLINTYDSNSNDIELYEMFSRLKVIYTNQSLPDFEKTDFDKLQKESKVLQKPKLFDPANLFQGV